MDGALLLSERLRLVRSDACASDEVLEFFVRSVHHLEPWLPEAGPIASDPAFRAALHQHVDTRGPRGARRRSGPSCMRAKFTAGHRPPGPRCAEV